MRVFLIEVARVDPLGDVFKGLGDKGCEDFEHVDPQFIALSRLSKFCGTLSVWLAALNGLVSYMLSMRGEDFWTLFTEFAIRRCGSVRDYRGALELVSEFTSNYNRLSLKAKLGRLKRVALCYDAFEKLPSGDLRSYVSSVSHCLESGEDEKTIVFSAKIAYYVLKSVGIDADVTGIPIPADRRVTLVTLTSGLVNPGGKLHTILELESLEDLTRDLMKRPNIVRRAWDLVSKASGVPAVKLDAVLWLVGRYVKCGGNSVASIVKSLRELGVKVEEATLTRLVTELTYAFRS